MVVYIAGYITRAIFAKIKCAHCQTILAEDVVHKENTSLLNIKNRGGLITPTKNVTEIIRFCERLWRLEVLFAKGCIPQGNVTLRIATKVIKLAINANLFSAQMAHFVECGPENNHFSALVKAIVFHYLNVRMHHYGRQVTDKLTGSSVRHVLTKEILFKGQ